MTRYEMLVVNRTVALKRLEARSGVREMKILANSLLQSIQYGTPLTEALQSIAAEARAGQLSELEQKAGRISAVIGVPLIVLVLFPVIALIIAPAAMPAPSEFFSSNVSYSDHASIFLPRFAFSAFMQCTAFWLRRHKRLHRL